MKDELGNRMKTYYEDRTRTFLPRRTNVIIRIDGKAFHTYTSGLQRPFDTKLIDDMNETTKFLCESIQGAKFGYVQSDEISILLTDYDKLTTDAWFDNNIQKMVSIAASLATAKFNQLRVANWFKINERANLNKIDFQDEISQFKLAYFDARVFTIPFEEEVINYFTWRQQDATRNSISSVAQSLYSHEELKNKTTDMMQELIFQKGFNWNDFPIGQKRGRTVVKREVIVPTTPETYAKAKDKGNFVLDLRSSVPSYGIRRNQWVIEEPPIFTQEKNYVRSTFKKEA